MLTHAPQARSQSTIRLQGFAQVKIMMKMQASQPVNLTHAGTIGTQRQQTGKPVRRTVAVMMLTRIGERAFATLVHAALIAQIMHAVTRLRTAYIQRHAMLMAIREM